MSPFRSIQLILFDLGGPLLADDELGAQAEQLAGVLGQLGRPARDRAELGELLSRGMLGRADSPAGYALWQLCRPDRAAHASGLALWQAARATFEPPRQPGAVALLESLRKSCTLGLFTAYPMERQTALLAAHGLERFFRMRVALPHPKPDPRGLLGLIEAYGGRPASTVVVGDRCDRDVAAARAAGVRSVWVRVPPWDALLPRSPGEEPDAEVAALEDLPGCLQRLDGLADLSDGPAPLPAEPREPVGATEVTEGSAIRLWRSRSCFACGTENHVGLDLAPQRQGTEVRAVYWPKPAHRGWSRLVHGGILATALDEIVCLAAAQAADTKVVTVKAELRYLAPAFIDRVYGVRAWPTWPSAVR